MSTKNIRVLADAGSKILQTVNIVTSGTTLFPTYAQQTTDDRNWHTVQDSGGAIAGLKTIVIPDYLAPA